MQREQAAQFIDDLLRMMMQRQASDLFLVCDSPPALRVDGKIEKVTAQPLTAVHTLALARSIMNERQAAEFERSNECNFAISPRGIGRFRVNAYLQQGSVGLVLRTLPNSPPTVEALRLPLTLKDLALIQRGLILVVGATGAGKSNTLAAMIHHRNAQSFGHIITLEDPIEFVHTPLQCVVSQREIGLDTENWGVALKNALRQSPDVILMGEIRDAPSMEAALSISRTGHLCLATLHANSSSQALERILEFFPKHHRAQVLSDLSLHLKATIAQRLLPRSNALGRIAAVEVMQASPLVCDRLAKGDIDGIKEAMRKGQNLGMQTFDQALFDLFEMQHISYDEALRQSDSINDLRLQIKLHSQRARRQDPAAGTESLSIL